MSLHTALSLLVALAALFIGLRLGRRRGQSSHPAEPRATALDPVAGRDQLVLEEQRRRRIIGEIAQVVIHQLRGRLSGIGTLFATDPKTGAVVLRAPPSELRERLEELESTMSGKLSALEGLGSSRTWVLLDLDRLLRLAAHPAKRGDLKVEVDVAPDAVNAVSGDPARLGEVMAELVRNAQKSIRRAGRAEGRISIRARRETGRVVIEVEDNGTGIPSDVLPHIWLPGFTTDKEEGWGLGLFFVREQVARHGGTVEAWNADGGGAVLRVALPFGTRDAVTEARIGVPRGPQGARPDVVLAEAAPSSVAAIRAEFSGASSPEIVEGSVLGVAADAIVIGSTSFGTPLGELRAQASAFFGDELEWRAQAAMRLRGALELLVGQAIVAATGDARIPYVIFAPLMRSDGNDIRGTANCYLAARGALDATIAFNAAAGFPIRRLALPLLGTAAGISATVAARQLRAAYEEVILGKRRRMARPDDRLAFERDVLGLAAAPSAPLTRGAEGAIEAKPVVAPVATGEALERTGGSP